MPVKKLIFIALTLTLGGCAQLKNATPGSSITEIEKQFGSPTHTCKLPSGETRMIWSQQPYGHNAWATDVSSEGRIGEVTQVLNDKSFDQLGRGIWTPEAVQCAFGPPAEIDQVGIPSARKIVWSYRYRQSDVWYALMYVYFGKDGKQVTSYNSGPDPMFMEDWSFPGRR